MTIRVAVPIVYSNVRLHLERGRRWSVAEHLLLFALKGGESTAEDLSKLSNLPTRMVLEALINLMRVGWVEIVASGDRVRFAITSGGTSHVDRDELPVVLEPMTKDMKFAIDQVLGRVLRWRELTFVSEARFQRMRDDDIVVLPATRDLPPARPSDIVASLLDADESLRGMDRSGARPGSGWILATVVGERVEGLPADVPDLVGRVLAAAKALGAGAEEQAPLPAVARPSGSEREVHLSSADIVTGGEEHRTHLLDTIRAARSWIAIHSTFVRAEPFQELLPHLERAARDWGVRTDIFWGKGDERERDNPARRVVEGYRREIAARELQQSIRVHPFSTGSHAKILIADDGRERFQATIGSCNWLYTGWNSFEVSVRLADGPIVADVMETLAEMAYQATGDWTGVTADLAARARAARADVGRRQGRRVTARLLHGPEHVAMFEKARDDASRRIMIASHRLGAAAENMALVPTRAAVAARGIDASVYFSTPSDRVTVEAATALRFKAAAEGLRITQVNDPTIHAKFMLWDDDDLVVTSQNLLSGDPLEALEELGVHIRGAGVARDLADRTTLRFQR